MMPAFPEIVVSLTIQCTFVLLLTRCLVRRAANSIAADRLWSCGHLMILLLSLAGVLLPHLRLFRSESLLSLCHQATMFPISQTFWTIVFWTWVSVASVLIVNLLRSLTQMSLTLRHATPVLIRQTATTRPDSVCADIGSTSFRESLTAELDTLNVRIVTADSCFTPFCWQLHQPVIVLPVSVTQFPDEELFAVVRHELAHLKLGHPMMLFLQRLVEIGFWFHPLVWRASKAASMQRELAADRTANGSSAEVAGFLRSLMRLSVPSFARPHILPVGLNLFARDVSMVQRRVDQLLSIDWSRPHCEKNSQSESETRGRTRLLAVASVMLTAIWIPLNSEATGRALFSPWPSSTATLLQEVGFSVRDYELDSHRVSEQFHAED
ncbi:MAG: M56 family metallopeptidase [Planctomycetaceae bacterium]